jgi:FkbM family methyltransferase
VYPVAIPAAVMTAGSRTGKGHKKDESMLKSVVRRCAKELGYEILGRAQSFAAQKTLMGLLKQEEINLVIDVGANVGQFVHGLRQAGYRERIVSFEPQSSAHSQLEALAENDPKWTIATRTALGDTSGVITMHTSGNSVSSSILPMLASHREAAPESDYVGTEKVPLNRLDDILSLTGQDRAMLKIDVQGYEKPVLDGAPRVLACCRALFLEMSLISLYEGQTLAQQLWDELDEAGFDIWSFEPGFRNPRSGRMLQMDGVFVRRS